MRNEWSAPFPWPGGKSRVADVVWRAFGRDVPNFIDAACGSAAILLARPGGAGKIETINDADGFITNLYRAIAADPWGVAEHCDYPVSELDLHARHRWLVNQTEFIERMRVDPDYFDVKIAGWWVYGVCAWIGGGWCSVSRVKRDKNARPRMSGDHAGDGVHAIGGKKRPVLDGIGKGIHGLHNKIPHLAVKADGACAGRGVHSSALGTAGQGVHLPSLGNDKGVHGVSAQPGTFMDALRNLTVPDSPACFEWFRALAIRLRRVRIACGDFERVLRPSVLGKGKNVGGRRPCAVFLDPTYAHDLRASGLYRVDSPDFSRRAREWALDHGDDPELRICMAGYWDEHSDSMPSTWTVHRWRGNRGYAAEDNQNREKETLWFSPHCLPIETQRSLFEVTEHLNGGDHAE
jgi:hypothetical protein